MAYILLKPTSDTNIARVQAVLYNPFPEQIEGQEGEEITEVPQPDNIPGMWPTLYMRRDTKELYYHYEAVEQPQPPLGDPLNDLRTQLAEAQAAALEMHESQVLQNAQIAEANNATLELYELVMGGAV